MSSRWGLRRLAFLRLLLMHEEAGGRRHARARHEEGIDAAVIRIAERQ